MSNQQPVNETQANLLLHLQTNRTFLEQKIFEHFKIECIEQRKFVDIERNKLQKTLLKVYDFGNSDSEMVQFYKTVPNSIDKWIELRQQQSEQDETKDVIDVNKLMDLIFYCVHNGGFKKPKKVIEIQTQNPQKQTKDNNQEQYKLQIKKQVQKKPRLLNFKKKLQPIVQQEQVQNKKQAKPKEKQQEQQIYVLPKYSMPDKNVGPRYLAINTVPKVKQEPKQQPLDIDIEDIKFLQKNRELVKKRLKKLFDHYCSQQQNVGKHTTFDRIKYQCGMMQVGKFTMFCKATKIFDKFIGKQTQIEKFRKVSDGKKDIGFEEFLELMQLIDQQYIKKKKENDSIDDIPNFQARLLLCSPEKYKKFKKDIDLPFCTRQKAMHSTIDTDKPVIFYKEKNKELTVHSGRFSFDLQNHLVKQRQNNEKMHQKRNKSKQHNTISNDSVIRLHNMKQHRGPGMDWIIQDEDQSDHLYLSEYKLKDVVSGLKKRVGQVQKIQSSRYRHH